MKRKTDNFSKFYTKKNNAAIKEAFKQEKKAAKKERKEAIERHFEEKRQARSAQFPDRNAASPADANFKKFPGKKKPPTPGTAPASTHPAAAAEGKSTFKGQARSQQPGAPAGKNPAPATPAAKSTAPVDPDALPLNKYIAHGGICSRRDAAELIRLGKVEVNGKIVTEPGTKVSPDDFVKANGKKVTISRNFVYILLNKPKDYITTTDDPQGRRTVLDLIRQATTERVFPVGRLDRNTSGVLLLTNDGDLSQKLAHPKHEIKKIYHVSLDKPLTKADFDQIITGIELEDGLAHVDVLAYADSKDKTQIGLEIHSGRNRIVRRIFEHLGYDVRGLDRVMYAGLTKKNVQRGHWRLLTEKEIRILKYLNSSFRGSLSNPNQKSQDGSFKEEGTTVTGLNKAKAPHRHTGTGYQKPLAADLAQEQDEKSQDAGSKSFKSKKFSGARKAAGSFKKSKGPNAHKASGTGPKKPYAPAAPASPRGRKSTGSYNKSKFTSWQDDSQEGRKPAPGARKFKGAGPDARKDSAPSDRKPAPGGDRKPARKPTFNDAGSSERSFKSSGPKKFKNPHARTAAPGARKAAGPARSGSPARKSSAPGTPVKKSYRPR